MHITLLGGTGNLGRHILEHALNEGHHITALLRNPTRLQVQHPNLRVVQGDAMNAADVSGAIHGADAVVSSLGASRPGELAVLDAGTRNIIAGMRSAGVRRVVVVNAAGILQHNDRQLILERPTFPIFLRGIARAHLGVWRAFEQSELDWTLLCPPRMIDRPTKRPMQATANALPDGGGAVSLSDAARFVLSELEKREYVHGRVGVNA